MTYLEIDSNEPLEMVTQLSPVIPVLPRQTLNVDGWADYRWQGCDNIWRHCERKTWGEFLANPDRIEEQLHRHLTKQPNARLVFLLEGVPTQGQVGVHLVRPARSGVWVKEKRASMTRLSRVYSMLYQFSNYMQVVQTTSIVESGTMLAALFKADQKDNHETFKRHIKQVEFHADPRVTSLMGIASGLGDKRATDIIALTGTPWNFLSAGYCEHMAIRDWREVTKIKGIGETVVRNVLRAIGRPDV